MSELTFKDSQKCQILNELIFFSLIRVCFLGTSGKQGDFRKKFKHMRRWRNLRNHGLKRCGEAYRTGHELPKEQITLYDSGRRVTPLSLSDYKLSLGTIGRSSRNRVA